MALVRDECLLPCKDAPELGYAKESSSEQYVPDVFYKVKIRWYEKIESTEDGVSLSWTLIMSCLPAIVVQSHCGSMHLTPFWGVLLAT